MAFSFSGIFAGTGFAQNIAGSVDHPLIPRYDGAEIRAYEVSSFDEYRLVDGVAVPGPAGGPPAVSANPVTLEGKVRH